MQDENKDNQSDKPKQEFLMSENKLIKRNLLFLVVSILVFLVNYFVIPMIEGKYSISYAEDGPTPLKQRIIDFIINFPVLAVYFIYLLKNIKKLKYFDVLNFPITVINISILLYKILLSIVGYGAVVFLLIVPIMLDYIFSITITVCGLILDIMGWIKYIKFRKN